MTNEDNRLSEAPPFWSELRLPSLLSVDKVQKLHAAIETDWNPLQRTACQTAAGRALWKHVTNDMLAELLAGETQLTSFYQKIQKDCLKQAREVSGVILAVRTLWFDSKLEAAVTFLNDKEMLQVVLLGAGQPHKCLFCYLILQTDCIQKQNNSTNFLSCPAVIFTYFQ